MVGLRLTRFSLLISLNCEGDDLLEVLVVPVRVGDNEGRTCGISLFPRMVRSLHKGRFVSASSRSTFRLVDATEYGSCGGRDRILRGPAATAGVVEAVSSRLFYAPP